MINKEVGIRPQTSSIDASNPPNKRPQSFASRTYGIGDAWITPSAFTLIKSISIPSTVNQKVDAVAIIEAG